MVPLLLLVLALGSAARAEVVDIPDLGLIEGTTSKSAWSGSTIYEYRGVPFAKPPRGALRFKQPEPSGAWTGTYDATQYKEACVQMGDSASLKGLGLGVPKVSSTHQTRATVGSEDCLYMDIYTPTMDPNATLPVFVYIHGGIFMFGGSAEHKPGFLLDKQNIVLVVPQYRLGPFGFFYLNTMDAPGNMGLSDQALALQWVRTNIGAFGGDPSQITLGGQSAGAASASLHMINSNFNETHRLFDRVISISGSALALWASLDHETGLARSADVANIAGCTGAPGAVATCMRGKSLDEIYDAYLTHQIMELQMGSLGMGASIPVVQSDPPAELQFVAVPKSPQLVLENTTWHVPLPLLTSATKHEGIYSLNIAYQGFLKPNNLLEDTLFLKNELVAAILNAYGVNENSRVMADACTRRYFEREDLGDFDKMMPGLIDFEGVTFHKGPVFRQAELHSLRAKTYLYSFDYQGAYSWLDEAGDNAVPIDMGVTHGDDLFYLWNYANYKLKSNDDVVIAKRMVDMFTEFITTGDPTSVEHPEIPEFIAYNRDEGNFMRVDGMMRMQGSYRHTFTTARDYGLAGAASLGAPVLLVLAAAAALLLARQ